MKTVLRGTLVLACVLVEPATRFSDVGEGSELEPLELGVRLRHAPECLMQCICRNMRDPLAK